jgi:hypothetical protein
MLSNSTIYRNGNCGRGSVGGFFHMAGDEAGIYGISNNHVIANINNCSVGDFIFDGANRQIGNLDYWISLNSDDMNYIDAALFKYTDNNVPMWRLPNNLAKPNGFIDPRVRGQVYMMLENNERNWGVISNSYINYVVEFTLCGEKFSFSYLIEITPLGGNPFSIPGESGSIIMSSNDCIVGLLMGTNSDATRSYAVPFIDGILNYFSLNI